RTADTGAWYQERTCAAGRCSSTTPTSRVRRAIASFPSSPTFDGPDSDIGSSDAVDVDMKRAVCVLFLPLCALQAQRTTAALKTLADDRLAQIDGRIVVAALDSAV